MKLAEKNMRARLLRALETAKAWEEGAATVGEARKASLECIKAAGEGRDPAAVAAARSAGHAAATAHMADHSLGAAEYALKAVKAAGKSVKAEKKWQERRLPAGIRGLVLSARPRNLDAARIFRYHADMDTPALTDKNVYPDDKVLAGHLGRAKSAWDAFTARLASECPAMGLEWRFYNDGKSWLGKLTHKKKTVCWISVWDGSFRTTFYFMDKNAKDLMALDIDPGLKKAFKENTGGGKLKPITVAVAGKKALSDVFGLIRYKSA